MSIEIITPAATAITSAIYALVVAIFLRRRKQFRNDVAKGEKEGKPDFYKALISGLKRETISSLEDVENIYKGINGLGADNAFRAELSTWLREFLVYVIAENHGAPTYYYLKLYKLIQDEELPVENSDKYKELITKILRENENISPFADLPEAERGILSDVVELAKSNNTDRMLSKLHELSSIIKTKHTAMEKIETSNHWAVPLAVAGVVFTIIFGALPFLLSKS